MRESGDRYYDLTTGTLYNLVGAETPSELARLETPLVENRMGLLDDDPVRCSGDLAHLLEVHRRLFQDVYQWAGQLRTVDMRKANGDYFAPHQTLMESTNSMLEAVSDEDMLRGLSEDHFVERLAHHFDQLNYLHPFREGNGRTQRVYWAQVAEAAGHPLDWRSVSAGTNSSASRRAMERGDLNPLRAMLRSAVEAAQPNHPVHRSRLAKPPTAQGRRPAGAPDGAGGQFGPHELSGPEVTLDQE